MKNKYEISANTQNTIFSVLLFIFNILSVNLAVSNKDKLLVIAVYLGAYISISAIRHFFLQHQRVRYLLVLMEIVLILTLHSFDKTNNSIFILIVVMADIITGFPMRFASVTCIFGFVVYILSTIFSWESSLRNQDQISYFIMLNLAIYLLTFLPMVFAKHQILQRQKMKDLLEEVRRKTSQLEEMATFKERNRIAGEIHDTVGHTLTSVLVSLEAGRMLIGNDNEKAREKINIAREQVKKGLYEIRNSVKTIKEGGFLLDFERSFLSSLKEMEKELGIQIEHSVQLNKANLLPIQYHALLRAVQESITNGIRHGEATCFSVHLEATEQQVTLEIRDNGKGADDFVPGFGLSNMRERMEALGGNVIFDSRAEAGFVTVISIPIGVKEERHDSTGDRR